LRYLQKCHCYISSSARRSTRRRSRRRSSTSVSTRRADEPRPRAHTPVLIRTESCSFSPSPFLPRTHTKPSSSSVPRRRPRRPSSPPCLDSLRPEPHNLALCLLHPFPSSFEPTPGRIDLQSACDRRPPLPRRAGAPSLRRSPTSGPPPLDSRAR